MTEYSGFSSFLEGLFGNALGAFLGIGVLLGFFYIVLKVFDSIGIASAKASRLDPNSGEGEKKRSGIGILLFIAFIFFALFIAPNLRD